MRSGRVGGMSAKVTLGVCAVRVSSRRLPYLLRVMTPMVGIKGILGCVG